MMDKKELIAKGKAKSLYTTDDNDRVIMEYRDDTSAFDGKKIEQLAKKGAVNNQFNAFIMQKLEEAGIPTHFDRVLNENESLVYKMKMMPIECVVRNIAAGSICRRLGVEEGLDLNPPTFEMFLKNDALGDPMINEYHIKSFGWANVEHIEQAKALTFKVNEVLKKLFLTGNILLVDYKLEFGIYKGQVVLGDEFSPDGCRLWDKDTRKKLDKDRFRQGLGDVVESYIEVASRIGLEIK